MTREARARHARIWLVLGPLLVVVVVALLALRPVGRVELPGASATPHTDVDRGVAP
jgi:hypothetical protein